MSNEIMASVFFILMIHITHVTIVNIFHTWSWSFGTIFHLIYEIFYEEHCIGDAFVEIQIENLVDFEVNVEHLRKNERIRELK